MTHKQIAEEALALAGSLINGAVPKFRAQTRLRQLREALEANESAIP